MWRVQGFVGRVLHRCYGNTPLRLPQSHYVEDEFINSSTVLSTSRHTSDSSSQNEERGEGKKKQRTFQYGCADLPRYTALDAVGWGAATVLFMQICRRIHSQFSSGTEQGHIAGALIATSTLHKCGYRILLEILSKQNVLPRGRGVWCLKAGPESQNQDQSRAQSSNSSSSSSSSSSTGGATPHSNREQEHLNDVFSTTDQQGALLNKDCPIPEESVLSASCPLQNDANQDRDTETKDANDKCMLSEDRLAGAALNLKHVGDTSIPVILNIIGLESAKNKNYEEAFACFLAAAQHGYSKAQFNTGVCFEKGRGVSKDKEKALHYYCQAAAGGHKQAQYRYAKLLLTSRGHQSLEELNMAISLLEQSSAAGLTQAQVCLASVYSQEPVRDGSKAVQYLKMAAESGDNTALLFLGQCFESGFGVQQNLRTATECYKRAAQAGNKQAKNLLTPPKGTDSKEDAMLRSISSAPCFSAADRRQQQPLSTLTGNVPPSAGHHVNLPLMPHSWSTGSLCAPPALSSTPLPFHPHSTEGGACRWTVGIG